MQTEEIVITLPDGTTDSVQVVTTEGFVQVNAHMPVHGGSGVFMRFLPEHRAEALTSMATALGWGGLPADKNLTDLVPGCLVAGTMARPRFVLGTPSIKQGGTP